MSKVNEGINIEEVKTTLEKTDAKTGWSNVKLISESMVESIETVLNIYEFDVLDKVEVIDYLIGNLKGLQDKIEREEL